MYVYLLLFTEAARSIATAYWAPGFATSQPVLPQHASVPPTTSLYYTSLQHCSVGARMSFSRNVLQNKAMWILLGLWTLNVRLLFYLEICKMAFIKS